MKIKEHAVWFVKTDDLPHYMVNAKIKQIEDWLHRERPFGTKYDVVIVPSDTNKFSILKSDGDFRKDFQGDPDEWLNTVKGKLEDCLTIHLSV